MSSPARPSQRSSQSPRRSPRLAEEPQVVDLSGTDGVQTSTDEHIPWLGQAKKLDITGKTIVKHYEHKIIFEQKLNEGGDVVQIPKIKYRTVFEAESKERVMGANGFNPSRLGEYLISSTDTPDDVKLEVASKMRSRKAKTFVDQHNAKRKAQEIMEVQMTSGPAARQVEKLAKTDSNEKEKLRQAALASYVAVDSKMPDEWFSLIMHYLAIFFYMCRLSFHVASNVHFLRFLWAIRPNFAKKVVPATLESNLANSYLDEAYEEAQDITQQALLDYPGLCTLGMDGHREGKSRQVETITISKLGISTFAHAEYLRTSRATGKHLSELAFKHLSSDFVALVADNTGNNTGSQSGLFAHVLKKYPKLFCLGCYVHVFDLLLEDIAKLPRVKEIGDDAHFCVNFVRKHPMLLEEFFNIQGMMSVKLELVVFPTTRFAYLYFMIKRVMVNAALLRLLSESPVYDIVKQTTKRRGKEGLKAVEEFKRFEELVDTRAFKERLGGGVDLLEPISTALHYSEGDSVPLSHVYPIFQYIYDLVQQLDQYEKVKTLLPQQDDREQVMECVRTRWLGGNRKVGLQADVHMLAFLLDPYVQAVFCSAKAPTCDLLSGDVIEAALRALRHVAGDDDAAKRAVLSTQFMLWNSSYPELKPQSNARGGSSSTDTDASLIAQAAGNTAFSNPRLRAMQDTWDAVRKVEADLMEQASKHPDMAATSQNQMCAVLAKLRKVNSPAQFWQAQMHATARGASADERAAHVLFCRTAIHVSCIVGHTCGTERAGKSYKLVVTPLRASMAPARATKAIYIFSNYNASRHKQLMGNSYSDFGMLELDQVEADMNTPEAVVKARGLRRGSLIVEDAISDDDSDSDDEMSADSGESNRRSQDDASADDGDSEAGAEPIRRSAGATAAWSIPTGFKLGVEPEQFDDSLIHQFVYFRWREYGWCLGKITERITSATPRLFKKYNYRCVWADGRKGLVMLTVASYAFGPHAAYESWVLLERNE